MDWGGGGKVCWGSFSCVKLHVALTVSQKWNFINPSGSRGVTNVDQCIQTTAPCIADELRDIDAVHVYIKPHEENGLLCSW